MKTKSRIYSIDFMRFIAAISVVLFHYLSYSPNAELALKLEQSSLNWLVAGSKYGFLGVELFFMISGFVILYSANGKSWQQFTRSRFLRIYPTLWLAASITFIGLLMLGATSKEPTLGQYLANLTLMHRFIFNQAHLDGVYWTLTVELRFYFIIGILIACGWLTEIKLKSVMAIWCLGGLWCLYLNKQANFMIYGAYFSAGVGFYYLWHSGKTVSNILFLAFTLITCLLTVYLSHAEPTLSPMILVVSMLAFFIAFYMLISGWHIPLPHKILTGLGGITYPLYLMHQELGYSLLQYNQNSDNYIYVSLLLAGILCLLAWLIFRFFEPRANQWFGIRWDRFFVAAQASANDK